LARSSRSTIAASDLSGIVVSAMGGKYSPAPHHRPRRLFEICSRTPSRCTATSTGLTSAASGLDVDLVPHAHVAMVERELLLAAVAAPATTTAARPSGRSVFIETSTACAATIRR
jgi:hypothetical protein